MEEKSYNFGLNWQNYNMRKIFMCVYFVIQITKKVNLNW